MNKTVVRWLVGPMLLGFPSLAEANGIRVKSLSDGTPLIFNEERIGSNSRSALRELPGAGELSKWIWHYAGRHRLDPRLVQAVIQVESAYNPNAVSKRGAMGLMQLMPATAKELGVENAFDLRQNVAGGTKYLRQQIDAFSGNLRLALAAYNAGPGAVASYRGVPPYRETKAYIEKVLHLYRGHGPSSLVQEHWKDVARRRDQSRREAAPQPEGGKVYLVRDPVKGIVFTTSPPASH